MKQCMRVISTMTWALVLASCQLWPFSSPQEDESPKTLAALLNRPVTVQPSRLPEQHLVAALEAYRKVLENPANDIARQEALIKLARLHSLLAENALSENQMQAMHQHLASAADYYRTLLQEYRNSIDLPAIEYQLARVLALQGDIENAHKLLAQIAKTNDARFEGIEAHFRLAESAFAAGQYTSAVNAYTQVIQAGQETPFYNTARYKRGWAYFKLARYTDANKDFSTLLDDLTAQSSKTAPKGLRQDTLRILALSFSYLDGPKSLKAFFSRHGHRPWEADLYRALANQYFEQERFQDTARTLQTFVENNRYSPHAPTFAHRSIEVLEKAGFVDLVLVAKQKFVNRYHSRAPYWQNQKTLSPRDIAPHLRAHLADLMAFFHAEAQRKKTPRDYLNAAKWYEIFLQEFPDAPDAAEKRWLLAEAYADAGRIDKAAAVYEMLAYGAQAGRHGRAEQAAYRLIAMRQRQLKQSTPKQKSFARNLLIDAALRFTVSFPKSKKLTEVLALLMEEQIAAGQIAASVETAQQLLTRPDGQKFVERAREVIADGLFDLARYQQAEQAISHVLRLNRLSPKARQRYHRLRAQAIYKQGEAAQKQGQTSTAIAHYLRLAKLEPSAPESIQAQFDAATLMLNIGQHKRAIEVLQRFRKQYPKHALNKTIPAKLIVAYEAIGEFGQAARLYAQLAEQAPDPKKRRILFWQAAESWEKTKTRSGQEAAVRLWKKYIKQFPTPLEYNIEAMQHLIDLYQTLGIAWKRDFWRNKLVNLVSQKRVKDARARTLAANAQLAIANQHLQTFKNLRLTQPLAKSLLKKRQAMKKALSAYERVLEIGIRPMATEAAFHIGEAYQHLAKAMLNSPRPKGLSELALEEYNALLEEKVYPFEDKAIEAYEATWSLVRQGIWDKWTHKAFKALQQLMPARYEKTFMVDDYAH